MSRIVLKYIYFVLGMAIALLSETASLGERRQLRQQSATARSPLDAAAYRANELVRRPLRTLWLIIGYELIFFGIPACAAYTEEIIALLGDNLGGVAGIIGALVKDTVSASLIPVLPLIGAVVGLVFALIVHQSLGTASDIRLALS